MADHFDLEIFSDASLHGWGIFCNGESTRGWWTSKQRVCHINYLELYAIFLGLQCFAKNLKDISILIRTDNTTALAYINRMSSVQHELLNNLAREIWTWCESRNL
ncbi:unnamed protein product, partial [Nesidiocoris tenuis]